ncbi:hypothetical protein DUI87_21438 [Hirundo rustica rustica]|uniref:Uncharacterized protein n=1 Tax=Hirundo rustica rustica TaxID=333673 RepID=A0A3M0JPR5_HIRRU|nr:hypothetical protein DUI87_21438 [Hirundo rustica rustica]
MLQTLTTFTALHWTGSSHCISLVLASPGLDPAVQVGPQVLNRVGKEAAGAREAVCHLGMAKDVSMASGRRVLDLTPRIGKWSFVACLLYHHHLHPKKEGILSQILTGSLSGLSCAGSTSFVVWCLGLPQDHVDTEGIQGLDTGQVTLIFSKTN